MSQEVISFLCISVDGGQVEAPLSFIFGYVVWAYLDL